MRITSLLCGLLCMIGLSVFAAAPTTMQNGLRVSNSLELVTGTNYGNGAGLTNLNPAALTNQQAPANGWTLIWSNNVPAWGINGGAFTNTPPSGVLASNTFPVTASFGNLPNGGMILWNSNNYGLWLVVTNRIAANATTNQLFPLLSGSGAGLPATGAVVIAYGSLGRTNWSAEDTEVWYETNSRGNLVTISNGQVVATRGFIASGGSPGILASNTAGAGADFSQMTTNGVLYFTNAELGVRGALGTNGLLFMSNAMVGSYMLDSPTNFIRSNSVAYMQITNGHVFVTNFTASGQSVDIDASVAGSIFWGSGIRSNFVDVTTQGLSESNALGSFRAFADGFIFTNTSGGVIRGTNGQLFVSGVVWLTNSLNVGNGLQVAGATVLSNGVSIYGSLGVSAGLTYSNLFLSSTNGVQEGAATITLDFAKPAIIITTNATFAFAAGAANVQSSTMNRLDILITNSAAANITFTFPAPWRVLKPQLLNQSSTGTVTNAGVMQLWAYVWPGLCSNVYFMPAQ